MPYKAEDLRNTCWEIVQHMHRCGVIDQATRDAVLQWKIANGQIDPHKPRY